MKTYHAIIVFLILVGSALFSGITDYLATQKHIVEDMNHALEQTLKQKQDHWLTPDTTRIYRSHLRLDALRRCSFVCYAMPDSPYGLKSKVMRRRHGPHTIAFQSYAGCNMASVWSMADHTATKVLSLLSLLWLGYAVVSLRRRTQPAATLGTMVYDADTQTFYDATHTPIRFTPMQHALMTMFYEADAHSLDKPTICSALWPKKPDASETLYTLIRRLKPIVEAKGNLRIVSERGKAYRLEPNE